MPYQPPYHMKNQHYQLDPYTGDNFYQIAQISQHFFKKRLKCPMAQNYLQKSDFWILLEFGQQFQEPSFRVTSAVGGQTCFVVAKGMVKAHNLGVGHWLQENRDSYHVKMTKKCGHCFKQIAKFLKNQVIPLMGKQSQLEQLSKFESTYDSLNDY